MELLIIEMLLWIGFGFLLWAMRERKSSPASPAMLPAPPMPCGPATSRNG